MNAEQIAVGLGKYVRNQSGFKACCPAHNDKSPSLSISDADDGKILVRCHAGCDQGAVIDALKRRNLWPEPERALPKPAGKKTIVATYDYVDPETGEIKLQVVRYEPKDFRQRRPDGNGGWSWSVPASERILFNLPSVYATDKIVIVVEGEKDVTALAKIGIVATCNPGGAGKWQPNYTDALQGRDVVILPDNDEPGENHASIVAAALTGRASRVRIVRLPDLPPKGDVADWIANGGTRADLARLIVKSEAPAPPPAPPMPVSSAAEIPEDDAPFKHMGFNGGVYYYLAHGSQQVVALTPSQHSKSNLCSIADLNYWEREFPSKTGANWDLAMNSMMRRCEAKGIFSPDMLRGRGAWYDDGRVVLHLGDVVYLDKKPTKPVAVRSRFIYEQGLPMRAEIDNPLSATEAKRFLDLVAMMPWENDLDALLIAGWTVCAHIGGVLGWRPHIWVVGSKGSGKTHVMSKVIRPVLGDNCLFVVGETTEAGVRQSLKHDALPVLFDEAEGEDTRATDRLQRILALVRQSSSESGGKIAKGSVSGQAASFQIRSCFAFSSINATLVQQSDRSRVTVIELKASRKHHEFSEILATEAQVLTEQYITRFYARAIDQAVNVRANSATFATAATAVLGEQRAGDQIGALLAGAWSLTNDGLVSFDQAASWLRDFDMSEQREEVQSQSDEKLLLDFLMQQIVDVPMDKGGTKKAIGELVQTCRGEDFGSVDYAKAALSRLGFKVEQDGIYVSNTADGIKRLLRTTPWSVNWAKILRRLPNSRAGGVIYFGYVGSEARAVFVEI
jgi:putative DNA primase/helicase